MQQLALIPLTEFEKATIEQLVSFRIGKRKNESQASVEQRIDDMCRSKRMINEALGLVAKWDKQRIDKGLVPWNKE